MIPGQTQVLPTARNIVQFGRKKHAKQCQQFILAAKSWVLPGCVPNYAMIQVKLSRIKLH